MAARLVKSKTCTPANEEGRDNPVDFAQSDYPAVFDPLFEVNELRGISGSETTHCSEASSPHLEDVCTAKDTYLRCMCL
jgi:hypothetical protein